MDPRRPVPELEDRQVQEYRLVDEALRSYPQQPAPPELLSRVLTQLPPRQSAVPMYRLWRNWLCAIPFSAAIVLIAAWRASALLPIDWTARVHFQFLTWQFKLSHLLPQYGLMAGLTMIFAGLILLAGLIGVVTPKRSNATTFTGIAAAS